MTQKSQGKGYRSLLSNVRLQPKFLDRVGFAVLGV